MTVFMCSTERAEETPEGWLGSCGVAHRHARAPVGSGDGRGQRVATVQTAWPDGLISTHCRWADVATKDITDEQVVRAAARFHREGGEFVDALLAAETGQPLKVCERAIYRAEDRGLVDWGVSARTCWPTPLGTDLYLSPKGHSA